MKNIALFSPLILLRKILYIYIYIYMYIYMHLKEVIGLVLMVNWVGSYTKVDI